MNDKAVGQALPPANPHSTAAVGRRKRLPHLADEFRARRQKLADALAARGAGALLVSAAPNIRYLSGFTGDNAALLVLPGQAVLFTDPRFAIQAAQQVSCRVKICKGPLMEGVAAALGKLGAVRIGYEAARMTCAAFQALESRLPMKASLDPFPAMVEELRMIKSAAEIELIRRSVEINSRAFELAIRRVRPGMTERDLAAEIEYRMRRLGAERPSFETIVAAGRRSALPHAEPTAARLRHGDMVVVDMGAFCDGYASDMTRMLFLGTPGARVKRIYRAVLEAQLAGIDRVRAGVAAFQVDSAARRVLRAHGLDRAFVHSTGHGLGLEIHEPPRLGKRDKTILQPGMAVTIEPGVYLEDFGGIRIEDTVEVTETGCRILTPTSKELRVI
ncbi:MAG: Xaa-Pro peptidase family protein [Bryobacteraceae bacterium]